MYRSVFGVLLLVLFTFSTGLLTAQVREGGVITKSSDAVIPISITADTPGSKRLAQMAFSAHGRYRVESNERRASYVFKFSVVAPTAVKIDIVSGRPAKLLYSETVVGSSIRNAIFKACDRAVEKTSGLPGFFSGKLAFISERTGSKEVYTSDLFFGSVLQQTNDHSESVMPRWSPDGSKIIYTGYFENGFPDIHEIDTNLRRRERFVSLKGTNSSASYSPDGRRVAMILTGEGNPEVYVANATGRRQIKRLTRSSSIEATPSWSPNGDQLVLTSDLAGKPKLYLISVRGGSMRRIPTAISGYCAEPDWNPANPDLVSFTVASMKGFQIAVYSFSERKSRVITQGSSDGIESSWTNDGRHLVYTSRRKGSSQIFLLDTETGKTTLLSPPNLGKVFQADFLKR
ncbi:MAG: PD40 domain-containing protein [Opitutaceae bacterium]|nr:PD40 domain-containing protein [Opitutaceae bacterium]